MKIQIDKYANAYKVVSAVIDHAIWNICGELNGDLYVVKVGVRHAEEDWMYITDLYDYADSSFTQDWWEGERNIDIVGFTPLNEVEMKYVLEGEKDG